MPASSLAARLALVLAVASGTTMTAATAFADPPRRERRGDDGGGPPPAHQILRDHADELGLSDAVKRQIAELVRSGRESREPLRRAVRDARERIADLSRVDNPDRAQVMAAIEAHGRAEIALRQHDMDVLLRIRALLTPEQRQKLRDIMEEERERHGRRGRGGRQGGPPDDEGGPDDDGPGL
jgi:Spy/CpxP family protein refolding chaperone